MNVAILQKKTKPTKKIVSKKELYGLNIKFIRIKKNPSPFEVIIVQCVPKKKTVTSYVIDLFRHIKGVVTLYIKLLNHATLINFWKLVFST